MSSGTTLVVLLTVTSAVVCRPATESDVALFLTPLLKDGRVHEAQRLSKVSGGFVKDVVSYAGYITVDDACESHLFFWFFPARNNASTAPVVLWLNGGPGVTSLLGAMVENGPLKMTADGEVLLANVSWTDAFSMLYVDSPVGAGYSYTTRSSGLATTMDDIMTHLYSLLLQFFLIFPQFADNDLYIGGQSYAGKYVPTLGQYIHDHNLASPPVHLNLKGVYVGSGLCDAATMFPEFPESLFYTGLISDSTRRSFRSQLTDVINKSLAEGTFDISDMNKLWSGADNASENGDINNILGLKHSLFFVERALEKFLSSASTREILHVDLANGKERGIIFNADVYRRLLPLDMFKNTNQQNAFLMDNYKVLHYSANLDLVVSVAMTEAFLGQLQWSGADQYRSSVRSRWFSDTAMMGWVTTVGNFTRVVVRNAGHHTPHDQPEAAYLMMTNFVFDRPFNTEMPDTLFV